MKKTKKVYEEHLNKISPEQESEGWIIGGKMRISHMWRGQWGTALRKYDPISFEVGFSDFKRNKRR